MIEGKGAKLAIYPDIDKTAWFWNNERENKYSRTNTMANNSILKKNTQQEALQYLLDKKAGTFKELEENINNETIKEFELVGFIKRGGSGNENTWRMSNSASTFYKSIYGNPSFLEKIKGYFCHYALGI